MKFRPFEIRVLFTWKLQGGGEGRGGEEGRGKAKEGEEEGRKRRDRKEGGEEGEREEEEKGGKEGGKENVRKGRERREGLVSCKQMKGEERE